MNPEQKYPFLPTSRKEMDALGWEQADVILFTGDAYVDHPSFGVAIIGRVLQREGYRVAIVAQPNWRDDLRDFRKLGAPRLFFGITSGSMDSMVNHYTAAKRLRSNDAYTPDGRAGQRPDYAVKVYAGIVKDLFPNAPLVLGGIEASLRRLTHYDYWTNTLLPSILADTQAHILVYGMGERSIVEIANRINKGQMVKELTDIPQTAFITSEKELYNSCNETIILNSFEQCVKSSKHFGDNFIRVEVESNRLTASRIVEPIGSAAVVVNPPYPPATPEAMDSYWDLPFQRQPHPRYRGKTIPAWDMIKFSVNIHRGCFGGCSFCTISAHQGRFISSRTPQSVLKEVNTIVEMPDFKGYLSDLGGPSANMYGMRGKDMAVCGKCKRPSCIYPSICKNLNTDHSPLLDLYRRVRAVKGIKKAFVGSGVRYDLIANQSDRVNRTYLEELMLHHVSGRLKVAPEHTEPDVLELMRKPSFSLFEQLKVNFDRINRNHSLKQQLIPYFISSHPGCSVQHMQSLRQKMRTMNLRPEQVQDFTPTPMTLASTVYYTGVDPYTGKRVVVSRTKQDKQKQKEQFFWHKKR
jgi:uncharacterized radical SAM protein YgiQ